MTPGLLKFLGGDYSFLPRMGLACMAGGLTVLTLPPFSWSVAVPVAYSAFFLLLRNLSALHAFPVGWAFGLGQFGFGISWIAESFYVDAERFGALAIPAVAGLSAGLAVFPAMAAALFAVFAQRRSLGSMAASLLLATCWVAAEWSRGHLLTGFPWNLAAYALVDHAALRQPAAWVGSYGLSFLTVLVGVLPGAAFSAAPPQRLTILAPCAMSVIGLWGAGAFRLATEAPSTGIDLRIVQGNVQQREKWAAGNRDATFELYLDLSSRPGNVDLLLWPETAFPGFLDEDAAARARINGSPPGV